MVGHAFSDDCAALIGGTHTGRLHSKAQKMLDELSCWGIKCGLRFNPSKSIAVYFSRRKKPLPPELLIEGKTVDYHNTVKYLGVPLDRKLLWQCHIDEKINKAKKTAVLPF